MVLLPFRVVVCWPDGAGWRELIARTAREYSRYEGWLVAWPID